jgi:hypothetical protein
MCAEEEQVSLERERQGLLERERAARSDLFATIRANQKLNDKEVALLRSLPVKDRLELFASLDVVGPAMEELLLLLRENSTDRAVRDSIAEFWKTREATGERDPLQQMTPAWWKERLWRMPRYARLSFRGRIKLLSDPALELSHGFRIALAQELVDEHSSSESFGEAIGQASFRLRLELLVALRSDLLWPLEALAVQTLSKSAAADTAALHPRLVEAFWAKHGKSLTTRSPLFPLAPVPVQREIIREHFHSHLAQLEQLFGHKAETSGDWAAPVVYNELDARDEELAGFWSSGSKSDHETARMLSARAAEKVARWFYQKLGFEVTDIAMHQLSGQSAMWKTHDLLLDGSKAVDVKNARLPVNNKAFYVEHVVPSFKRDRAGRDVTIAAVVSPYLSLAYLKDPDSAPFEVSDVRYLGETSLDAIARHCSSFSGRDLEVQDPAAGAFVPPWYFDFPDAWYHEHENLCAQLRNAAVPDEIETHLLYFLDSSLPLPKYIAARLPLPAWFLDSMEPWMRTLVDQLQAACRPRAKLAHLFLLLLTDFLSKLREPRVNGYQPSAYFKLLFEGGEFSGSISYHRPLGIADPLGTIRRLCESLQQLWNRRDRLDLVRFTGYRLSGGGILQGREQRSGPWETVLAYCGGFVEGKGRCGCAPLVIGVESQCSDCRRLVCRKCGYCSERCDARAEGLRLSASEPATSAAPREDPDDW